MGHGNEHVEIEDWPLRSSLTGVVDAVEFYLQTGGSAYHANSEIRLRGKLYMNGQNLKPPENVNCAELIHDKLFELRYPSNKSIEKFPAKRANEYFGAMNWVKDQTNVGDYLLDDSYWRLSLQKIPWSQFVELKNDITKLVARKFPIKLFFEVAGRHKSWTAKYRDDPSDGGGFTHIEWPVIISAKEISG